MKVRIFVVIILFVMLAVALDTGFVLVWRLFSLTLLALLAGYLWAFISISGIGATHGQLPKEGKVGDSFTEEFTVFNKLKMPKLLLEAKENSEVPGHTNAAVFNLKPSGSYSWRNEVLFQRRGKYSLGTLIVAASDPFGFFHHRHKLGEPQDIIVIPETLDLPQFELLSQYDSRYGGSSPWLPSHFSTNVAGVRDYNNGDSLRHIHWRSTAHKGKPLVKVFDPERSHTSANSVWIVLDMHRDCEKDSIEYGVTIAASLIKKYSDSGWSVGMISSDVQGHRFPLDSGNRHMEDMLTALALIQADGEVTIDRLISSELGSTGVDSAIIVITSSVGEELTVQLRHLKSRGRLVVAILLDANGCGMADTARTLIAKDIQVHVVQPGDDLASGLDSRNYFSRVQYAGVV